jgi:hypothetical protein
MFPVSHRSPIQNPICTGHRVGACRLSTCLARTLLWARRFAGVARRLPDPTAVVFLPHSALSEQPDVIRNTDSDFYAWLQAYHPNMPWPLRTQGGHSILVGS